MRNTKQRECILDIINNSYDHLNAYQVYDKAREIISNISLGTVYRNLSWLCDNDTRCGYVIDVARDKNVKKYINGNLVVDYEIKYRGICTKCQREENL